jgi:hypothetical protein
MAGEAAALICIKVRAARIIHTLLGCTAAVCVARTGRYTVMRVSTTDPITLKDVVPAEGQPFVVEGTGENALKIYFESEENKQAYLGIAVEHPGEDFTTNLNNPV